MIPEDKDYVRLTIGMPKEMRQAIRAAAASQDQPMSAFILKAVQVYLEVLKRLGSTGSPK